MKQALLLIGAALTLGAHPLGNYSVNHYARFEVRTDGVYVDYVLDFAEFPTQQVKRSWTGPEGSKWIEKLEFRMGGHRITPLVMGSGIDEAPGQGGLPVMTFRAKLRLPVMGGELSYDDRNFADRAGWKEIVITAGGEGVALTKASHTSRDLTKGLTIVRMDEGIVPPHEVRAHLEWKLAEDWPNGVKPELKIEPILQPPAPAAQATDKENMGGDRLTQILTQPELPWTVLATALAIAFGIGAAHALEPGHGKTMVAAYLVGSRGTWRHALWLGAITTFTHTFTVFVLGLLTLAASQFFATDRIYPVLMIGSALTIVVMGAGLVWKRSRFLRERRHHHHDHDHAHPAELPEVTFGNILAMGVSGGLVPCPAAVVLLLGAVAVGKIWLGMSLLLAFSLGLAVVLAGVGLVVVFAKQRWATGTRDPHQAYLPQGHDHGHDHHHHGWTEWAPLASAVVILAIGVYFCYSAWRQL